MPRSRFEYVGDQYPYFLTATVNNWLPIFTRPETVNIVIESWKYLQERRGFELFGYVILENHLHFVARSTALSKDIQSFKSFTANSIISFLSKRGASKLLWFFEHFKRPHKTESKYQVWEEGSHPLAIETEAMMAEKLRYIHQNPVKRGYVDLPEHWRYSSARNYAGLEGLIEVNTTW